MDDEDAERDADTSGDPEVVVQAAGIRCEALAQVLTALSPAESGGRRSRLLPREIRGRGGRNRRNPENHVKTRMFMRASNWTSDEAAGIERGCPMA